MTAWRRAGELVRIDNHFNGLLREAPFTPRLAVKKV